MSPDAKRWKLPEPLPPAYQERFPGVPSLLVRLLYNRGIISPQAVRDFLGPPSLGANPFSLPGIHQAVARLRQAIRSGEKIAVYGDFDADGVCATAVLVETLQALGADAHPYIPHRVDEGYGLNLDALRKLYRNGVRLVVTVDCGIRSVAEVAAAQRGLDLIVTDHHSVGSELPPAVATINPKLPESTYPFQDLAGVGVAFKLAQALLLACRRMGKQPSLVEDELMDLVALGTVADIVPLLGENRDLVRLGLKHLNDPQRPGLKALMVKAGVRPGEITATTIGYVLGPRLNAAGRLADAMTSYRLLTTRDPGEAEQLAAKLDETNRQRQKLTEETLEQARAQVLAEGTDVPLLFAAGENFLPGIVGLVAGRLTEELYRPAVVVEVGEKQSRGSCRSIPDFHITAALDRCRDLLVRHGGHAAAAGFTVENSNLESLRDCLRSIAAEELAGKELIPTLAIDAEVALSEMDWATRSLLDQMEPCGNENPVPLFLSRGVIVRSCRPVGTDARHLRLVLSDGRVVWDAIAFHQGIPEGGMPERIDVVYSLEAQEWNGEKRLQLVVEDFRPAE
ncbi:MAG: single-stranded-DNA-specific exonuclease RecJ [Anaerolineae bacterium]|nr:single-stranded-DNA-specific exonuclease RecJ [Anaerolineae bacterium]MDH7472450.1 single-stranded-DNA-specific exonuclease RecJ [Anaerolineae bacterium]